MQKWKYVFHKIIAPKILLIKEALDCQEIMDLFKDVVLMRIVSDIGPCYKNLVKEFIVNISFECNVEESNEYRKVYIIWNCVKFSPSNINDYLSKSKSAVSDKITSIDKIAKEIICGEVKKQTKKGLLSSGSLGVKYDILSSIGAVNRTPTNHNFGITTTLAKLIFQIGTNTRLNFGEYVFEQTMKHVDSFVVKLSIAFPCLLSGTILNQHPKIVHPEEAPNKKVRPLIIDYLSEHMFQTLWCQRTKTYLLLGNILLYPNLLKRMCFLSSWMFQRLFKKQLIQAPLRRKIWII